jgi:hypothetical protein
MNPPQFDWRGWIKLGAVDLPNVIRAAYELSGSQGLGFLHYRQGGFSDEEIDAIIGRESGGGTAPIVAGMDYVNGRSVKMYVRKEPSTGDLYVKHRWYDHSRGELEDLLGVFGVPPSAIDDASAAQAEADAEYLAEESERARVGLAWLREHGGRVKNPALAWGSVKPEIHDALSAASSTGLIQYDYTAQEYFIPPAESDLSDLAAQPTTAAPATDEPIAPAAPKALPDDGRGP